MSSEKSVIACQPFRHGVASVICSGCFCLMAFPSGSARVKCAGCQTVTSGLKVNCTSCKNPLKIKLKEPNIKCDKCGYEFLSTSTFRLAVPDAPESMKGPKPIKVTLTIDPSLRPQKNNVSVKALANQPLRSNFSAWEMQVGVASISTADVSHRGKPIDTTKSAVDLGLSDNAIISIVPGERRVQAGGHEFESTQFNQPTNCAYCQKFIWGLYHQGKKCLRCHAPVHHRCAEMFSQMCEATMRESLGLKAFVEEGAGDGDDEAEGYPIQSEDMVDWESLLSEEACPEAETNFMKSFARLGNFTDEDIGAIWSQYDANGDGVLDRQEIKKFVCDLTGALGVESESAAVQGLIDRLLTVMDTHKNGTISWDEFYLFYKAQQDGSFMASYKGVHLSQEKLYEIWYHYDVNNTGCLECEQVLRVLQDCASLSGASDVVKNYKADLRRFFVDSSKKVVWEDFCTLIVPIIQECLDGDL